jgi:hypothetical protein
MQGMVRIVSSVSRRRKIGERRQNPENPKEARRLCNHWSAEDWQVFFDERAGIIEFDGGLPRAEAEAQTFACRVVEWLNHNPERSGRLMPPVGE